MSRLFVFLPLALIALAAASCATTPQPTVAAPPPAISAPPAPGIAPEALVGRWGLAAYHRDADRARTIAAARGQCGHPYVIGRGPTGGVMMHIADAPQPTELRTKGGPDGRRYIGPEGPVGEPGDREILSFDGGVLTVRWLDPEIAGRYGTMVYVRCGAPGGTRRAPPPRA